MPATKIGIVYARGSGILRRWIVPDNDADLIASHPVSPGEAMILTDAALIPKDPALAQAFVENAITRVTGKAVPSPRCAVINALGSVESVIMADPALDNVPGKTLMLHADAVPGWKMVAGALTAPALDVQIDPVAAVKP
jgi:hypothetical protein